MAGLAYYISCVVFVAIIWAYWRPKPGKKKAKPSESVGESAEKAVIKKDAEEVREILTKVEDSCKKEDGTVGIDLKGEEIKDSQKDDQPATAEMQISEKKDTDEVDMVAVESKDIEKSEEIMEKSEEEVVRTESVISEVEPSCDKEEVSKSVEFIEKTLDIEESEKVKEPFEHKLFVDSTGDTSKLSGDTSPDSGVEEGIASSPTGGVSEPEIAEQSEDDTKLSSIEESDLSTPDMVTEDITTEITDDIEQEQDLVSEETDLKAEKEEEEEPVVVESPPEAKQDIEILHISESDEKDIVEHVAEETDSVVAKETVTAEIEVDEEPVTASPAAVALLEEIPSAVAKDSNVPLKSDDTTETLTEIDEGLAPSVQPDVSQKDETVEKTEEETEDMESLTLKEEKEMMEKESSVAEVEEQKESVSTKEDTEMESTEEPTICDIIDEQLAKKKKVPTATLR